MLQYVQLGLTTLCIVFVLIAIYNTRKARKNLERRQ